MDGDWMVGGIDLFFLMDSLVDGNEECDTGEVQIDGWIFEKKHHTSLYPFLE
jgi:hypothetical protein